MEKLTEIGGFFFRAKDPESAGALVPATPGGRAHAIELRGFRLAARAGPPVFDPQPETSDYFGDTQNVWMLNFRVRDLDKMATRYELESRSKWTRSLIPRPVCLRA